MSNKLFIVKDGQDDSLYISNNLENALNQIDYIKIHCTTDNRKILEITNSDKLYFINEDTISDIDLEGEVGIYSIDLNDFDDVKKLNEGCELNYFSI